MPFHVNSTEKAAHVCNTAIVKQITGSNQKLIKGDNDDEEVEEEEFFIDWNLEGLQDLLLKDGRVKNNKWLDEFLYPRIHRSIIHTIRSTYFKFVHDSR